MDFIKIDINFIKEKSISITQAFVLSSIEDKKCVCITLLHQRLGNLLKYDTLYRVCKKLEKRGLIVISKKNNYPTGIYLIEEENGRFYKIGVCSDIVSRIKQIQTGNPNKIKCLYFIEGKSYLEKKLHSDFKMFRFNGEWFFKSELILDEFKKIRNEI